MRIDFCMRTVYVNALVFFLNVYLCVSPEIHRRKKLIYHRERIFFDSASRT